MRRKHNAFLTTIVATSLVIISICKINAQVPAFGPETFGTGLIVPDGWTIKQYSRYTWKLVNSDPFQSTGYQSPNASGGSHIVIDASVSRYDTLISPIINCTNFTGGILRFGAWRLDSYVETLFVTIEAGNNKSVSKQTFIVPIDTIPNETWRLITIDLKNYIDHQPLVRIKFSKSKTLNEYGPLRLDDITLYGYTTTQPTDHFRTRTSGNWDNPATWESSPDSVYWMPSTLSPTLLSASISICNALSIVSASDLAVDQLIIKSGGSLTLGSDLTLNNGPGEDLQVEEGGIIDLHTHQVKGSGTIQLNGQLKTANAEGLYGTDATSVVPSVLLNRPGTSSIIEYNANTAQNITPLNPNNDHYNNLVTTGSGEKTLTASVIVSKDLKVAGGHLLLGPFDLTVGFTATGTPASYIKLTGSGKLTISDIGPEAKTFPIGNTSYNPVTIRSGSGLNWTVGIEDKYVSSDPGLAAINSRSVRRTWSIAPSLYNPPPLTTEVTLEYNDSDPEQVGSDFDKEAPVQVWRQATSGWLAAGGTQKPLTTLSGSKAVSFSTEATFSLFTITNLTTPLPIQFYEVSARLIQSKVLISFTNASESSIENYTVERSDDSQTYKPLQVVQPQNNDGKRVSYEVQDGAPLPALNFYRIKAKEKDGHLTYSSVVRVQRKESNPRLTVAPNPAHKGTVTVQLSNIPKGHYRVNLYNAEGKLLQHQSLQHTGGSTSFPLLVEKLATGTYVIELSGKEKLLQHFVIL